ncbi:MMPL family transporter [Actinoplanes sp. NPDC049802]|uniref:MMPL family transporter n=1 Tax=Actinoplanes sp. NPDC049802 TaxID=3154742 RepID=UPI0033DAF993
MVQGNGAVPDDAVQAIGSAVSATPGIAAVTPARTSPSGDVAVLQAFPGTAPQSAETERTLHRLRDSTLPGAVADNGLRTYVGGFTATQVDFTGTISSRLPLFIGIVVLLGALLLLLAFRSVVISILTAVMNLIAVAVCFGTIVAIFQWGRLDGLTGIDKPGPIDAFLPVFLFAILFGLSMDYQVFLLGRTHEAWLATRDNARAVITGQVETGRVITAAGAIMVLVFLSFTAGDRAMMLFGIGLGVTVLFDAFVIRTMLMPALMHLCGPTTWWMPRGLDRILPRLDVAEGPDVPAPHPRDAEDVTETGTPARAH